MSDVNTAIYQNQVQPVNPLTTASQVVGLQQGLNNNKLFQQQNDARVAIGQAYQQSIDPQTGQLDTNKLLANVANNPNASYMAGDVASQAQARQQQQLGITGAQIDQAAKKLQWINSSTGALLAKPNVAPSDVYSTLLSGLNSGILNKQDVVNEISTMPTDPAQLQTYLQQHQLRGLDQQKQFDAIYGTPQTINSGGQTNVVAVSPLTGTRSLGTVNNTLTPEANATRIPTFVNGKPGTVPQSTVVDPTGHPIAPATPDVPNGYTGRFPAAGAQPTTGPSTSDPNAAPAPAMPSGAPAGPAGFVQTGPALGQQVAADKTAGSAADQASALTATADQVPARKAALSNLETDLQNFTSGPGADWTKLAESASDKFNPFGDVFDPKGIASQEAFTKQATQLATNQLQALGGAGTDSKLDAAFHTNPNETLSKLGNQQIIGLLKGNEDAIAAKNQEWQKYLQTNGPGSSQDYGAFSTQFNKTYDPRVFQSVYMSPDQRTDLIKSMSPTEKTQFLGSLRYAIGRNWINPASWASNNATSQ